MQSFLVSTAVVALAEIGDKTQLLSLILAARFRKPLPIVLGILVATVLNHAAAAWLGQVAATWLTPTVLGWVMAVAFIGMGLWILVPDEFTDEDVALPQKQMSVFLATLFAFFVAEMGDKTQFATIALAAQYQQIFAVTAGTTLGMMLANVPAVYLGSRFSERLPTQRVHQIAAAIFIVMGLYTAYQVW
jgi:Ca2+/H+ antiporter, TMEM165/GDT1 family